MWTLYALKGTVYCEHTSLLRGQFFSSWSTAEVWLIEINHWEYYTNQPPTPMVSQEAGGHHALLMATSDHSDQ